MFLEMPETLTRNFAVVYEQTQKTKANGGFFKRPLTGFMCEANHSLSGEDLLADHSFSSFSIRSQYLNLLINQMMRYNVHIFLNDAIFLA